MPKLITREAIRARRLSRPAASKRVPLQSYPENIERAYTGVLVSLARDTRADLIRSVLAIYAPAMARQDAESDELADRIGRMVADYEAAVYKTTTSGKARLLAQGIGRDTNRFVKTAVGSQVKAVIGIDPLATVALEPGAVAVALDGFARRNVDLITSIPRQHFAQIRATVDDALKTGKRPEVLARELGERYDVTASRARLIARDQIGKLNGELTELRQRSIGVSGYTWRTSLDERVREDHKALEGRRFEWSSPPDVGHPGEDYQCRCRAEPDFGDLFD